MDVETVAAWLHERVGLVEGFEVVVSKLLDLHSLEQALIWLESPNAHLGARAIDALRVRGALGVLPALDAEEQGAYA